MNTQFQRSCVQWVKAEDAREQPILVERYRWCVLSYTRMIDADHDE